MDRKDWNRIGLAAAVVLVPGGFLLGAALAARRMRAAVLEAEGDGGTDPADDSPADDVTR